MAQDSVERERAGGAGEGRRGEGGQGKALQSTDPHHGGTRVSQELMSWGRPPGVAPLFLMSLLSRAVTRPAHGFSHEVQGGNQRDNPSLNAPNPVGAGGRCQLSARSCPCMKVGDCRMAAQAPRGALILRPQMGQERDQGENGIARMCDGGRRDVSGARSLAELQELLLVQGRRSVVEKV